MDLRVEMGFSVVDSATSFEETDVGFDPSKPDIGFFAAKPAFIAEWYGSHAFWSQKGGFESQPGENFLLIHFVQIEYKTWW